MIVAFIAVAAGVAGAPAPAQVVPQTASGDELVARFECARCHVDLPNAAGSGDDEEPYGDQDKSCVGCHQAIISGTMKKVKPTQLAQWSARIVHLRDASADCSCTAQVWEHGGNSCFAFDATAQPAAGTVTTGCENSTPDLSVLGNWD